MYSSFIAVLVLICTTSMTQALLDTCKLVNGRVNTNMGEKIALSHTTQTYSCNVALGGGGDIIFNYRYTSLGDYVIDNAAVSISKANLDQGDAVTDSTRVYALKLNKHVEHFVTGMVFGQKLGGPGSEPANVFPQSEVVQRRFHTFEDRIHHCLLVSDDSVSALLRVEFKYLTTTDTRPHGLYYTVTFQGNSRCRSTKMTFDN